MLAAALRSTAPQPLSPRQSPLPSGAIPARPSPLPPPDHYPRPQQQGSPLPPPKEGSRGASQERSPLQPPPVEWGWAPRQGCQPSPPRRRRLWSPAAPQSGASSVIGPADAARSESQSPEGLAPAGVKPSSQTPQGCGAPGLIPFVPPPEGSTAAGFKPCSPAHEGFGASGFMPWSEPPVVASHGRWTPSDAGGSRAYALGSTAHDARSPARAHRRPEWAATPAAVASPAADSVCSGGSLAGWRLAAVHGSPVRRGGGKDAGSGEAEAYQAEVDSLKLQLKLQKGVCTLAVAIASDKVTGKQCSEILQDFEVISWGYITGPVKLREILLRERAKRERD